MDEPFADTPHEVIARRARSFGDTAAAYDRARPGYPADAVEWLVGTPGKVVELGAGTGKLTELLVAAGHDVLATDPSLEMLARLRDRVPAVRTAVAAAEHIPARSRCADVVVCAQSFHWFDHERALPEIARVLRPGGHLVMVWNHADDGTPWVRRLTDLVGREDARPDVAEPAAAYEEFGDLEEKRFRFWHDVDRDGLLDLVRSRSAVAVLDDAERARVLDRVAALYDDYGRGHDGMKVPYVTRCFRTEVEHRAPAEPAPAPAATDDVPADDPPTEEREHTGTLLIDFR